MKQLLLALLLSPLPALAGSGTSFNSTDHTPEGIFRGDCETATPQYIGELCIDPTNVSGPLQVASSTLTGGYDRVLTQQQGIAHADMHITTQNASATTISTAMTFVKSAGTYTNNEIIGFAFDSGGRLTFNRAGEDDVWVGCTGSISSASGADLVWAQIVKNGDVTIEPDNRERIQLQSAGGGSPQTFAVQQLYPAVQTNDYFELWVMNESDTSNLTVETLNCSAMGF